MESHKADDKHLYKGYGGTPSLKRTIQFYSGAIELNQKVIITSYWQYEQAMKYVLLSKRLHSPPSIPSPPE